MTLSRSMSIKLAVLVAGIVVLCVVAVWQFRQLAADVDAALAAHDRWQTVYSQAVANVGTPLIIARNVLRIETPRINVAISQLKGAMEQLDAMALPADASDKARDSVSNTLRTMRRVLGKLQTLPGELTVEQRQQYSAELDSAYGLMARLESEVRAALERVRDKANQRTDGTVIAVTLLAIAVALGTVIIGTWQHRSVMGPLRHVAAGVQRIADGRFDQRLDELGHDELAALARDFNRMTQQLDELYSRLEQKVREQSRELARSERLASVGHLAAGVAHEINNPLAIIAGQAELALLKADALPEATRDTLQVICDEAFRCKGITQRLLSLSRGREEARQPVSLRVIAEEVVAMIADLPKYAGRTLDLAIAPADELMVTAAAGEMKQVLLNLVINGLEAVEPKGGRVVIDGSGGPQSVTLSVTDNGRGMDEQTLPKVFEPFFTRRRGTGEPGTGLGLSICHAIISDHEGAITAHSDGPGKGSTFTMTLPAAAPRAADGSTR